MSTKTADVIPRAAVSVVVRCEVEEEPKYVLVQRGKEPNYGIWSLPGGKIEIGEATMDAARRELHEETLLMEGLKWHDSPFRSSDSIHRKDDNEVSYHYVISQCFCTSSTFSELHPSDDAADAAWLTLEQIRQKTTMGHVTPGVDDVIAHAERLFSNGMLPCD